MILKEILSLVSGFKCAQQKDFIKEIKQTVRADSVPPTPLCHFLSLILGNPPSYPGDVIFEWPLF